ncbi:BrnA antitoxin family protein [Oligoflexia bacterium]|nr:BrnA antitoxin family protein [Oligoflexia bacterium]
MKKKLPKFKNDKEAEEFFEKDLSDYMTAENFTPMSFEFESKNKLMSIRVSENLLNALKSASKKRGMNYQKFVRHVLEEALKKNAA